MRFLRGKLFDAGATLAIIILVVTAIGTVSHKISKKRHHTGKEEFVGHDNPVEEFCQKVLETLGQPKKDLTPESPEKTPESEEE